MTYKKYMGAPIVAVIQSRETPHRIEGERNNITREVGTLSQLEFLSALDETLPWDSPEKLAKKYSGFILGGSSDFDFHGGRDDADPVRHVSHKILRRLEDLLKYNCAHEVPTMGICFGHQMIGHAFGAELFNDKTQSKLGTHEVHLTEEGKKDPLMSQLPASFLAQYAHKDSLTRLPDGATLLGSSDRCKYAALRYGKNMYTFQFHPEVVRFNNPNIPHTPSPEASKLIPIWIGEFVA